MTDSTRLRRHARTLRKLAAEYFILYGMATMDKLVGYSAENWKAEGYFAGTAVRYLLEADAADDEAATIEAEDRAHEGALQAYRQGF